VDLDLSQWRTLLLAKQRNEAPDLMKWSRYYEGTQALSYMDPELVRELNGRIRPVILNWPRLVVDSLEERLDVEGFRFGGSDEGDTRLWEWWQANDLDEQSQQAHTDALVERRSFVIVGAPDSPGDAPVITVESAQQVTASFDPRTRTVRAALKAWADPETGASYATLYLPDSTTHYMLDDSTSSAAAWEIIETDEHNLGMVPVVPIVNRPRTLTPEGVSELADVVPLSDAACKVATDMMVSAEFHAMPRRWVVGMGPDDFKDQNGRELTKWERIAGRVWATENPEAKLGQFPEADLRNFHLTINSLAALVSSMAGLPPDFLGLTTENPPSAEARRAGVERLVKRAERRQRSFGGSWERVMRLAMLIADGDVPAEARSLETVWRDASTPTVAQKADAAVKLHAAGISSTRQAREDVGYSVTQIKRMEADDASAADRILGGDLSSFVGPKPDQPQA
jgi:hypothetical protein